MNKNTDINIILPLGLYGATLGVVEKISMERGKKMAQIFSNFSAKEFLELAGCKNENPQAKSAKHRSV